MMATFSLSCMPRCITVSHVQSMLTLSGCALVRTGETVSHHSVSGAGMTAQGLGKVHHALVVLLPLLVLVLVLLLLLLLATDSM